MEIKHSVCSSQDMASVMSFAGCCFPVGATPLYTGARFTFFLNVEITENGEEKENRSTGRGFFLLQIF